MQINPEIKVFSTHCEICGTPLSGSNLYERGGKYYCVVDFQRTSPEELAENQRLQDEAKAFKKFFRVTT